MTKANAANERIKREYYRYLREALGRDEATIDAVAKALARFEEVSGGMTSSDSIGSRLLRSKLGWPSPSTCAQASL